MNKTTEALKLAEEALVKANHFHDYEDELAAIREALAESEITTPDVCGEVCARAKLCYGCGKALDEANEKLNKEHVWLSKDELTQYWKGYGKGKREALEEAEKVAGTAHAQGLQSIREAIVAAIRGLK